jgi:DNA invertase Pin-like site-specific DNA recombinase
LPAGHSRPHDEYGAESLTAEGRNSAGTWINDENPAPPSTHCEKVTLLRGSLNRLARSSRDLQNILHELQEKGCGFVSLGESWCDTTTDVGRLMMAIMAGIAEFERNLIRKRCEEGIQRAKRKGTKFGRPTALDHGQRRRIAERYTAGETMAELACEYECGEATIWRALQ